MSVQDQSERLINFTRLLFLLGRVPDHAADALVEGKVLASAVFLDDEETAGLFEFWVQSHSETGHILQLLLGFLVVLQQLQQLRSIK